MENLFLLYFLQITNLPWEKEEILFHRNQLWNIQDQVSMCLQTRIWLFHKEMLASLKCCLALCSQKLYARKCVPVLCIKGLHAPIASPFLNIVWFLNKVLLFVAILFELDIWNIFGWENFWWMRFDTSKTEVHFHISHD